MAKHHTAIPHVRDGEAQARNLKVWAKLYQHRMPLKLAELYPSSPSERAAFRMSLDYGVSLGYLTRHHGSSEVGLGFSWALTQAGRDHLEQNSTSVELPKPKSAWSY